jgi:tetratricopeptide (TPR) repeat protein
MRSLEPRWGGSYEAMVGFAAFCAMDYELNHRFWPLVGAPLADLASTYAQRGDDRKAVELYTEALKYGDRLTWLEYRASCFSRCGEFEQALADVERMLYYSPNDRTATALITRLKRMKEQAG